MSKVYDSKEIKPMSVVEAFKTFYAKHVECADCGYDYENHLYSCPYCTSEWIIIDGKARLK